VYGLATPNGSLSVSNVAQTLNGGTSSTNNGTTRIASIDVVKTDSFNVTLNTGTVILPDGYHDTDADGDSAFGVGVVIAIRQDHRAGVESHVEAVGFDHVDAGDARGAVVCAACSPIECLGDVRHGKRPVWGCQTVN